MKKKILAILMILMIMVAAVGCGNRQMFDLTYTFDYAYISLPNGECVEGPVQSWRDFKDGDQLQITIDGKTYLTDSTRCVLVKE